MRRSPTRSRWCALVLVPFLMVMTGGCATRSISDSGFPDDRYGSPKKTAHAYQGELDEFQILGINPANVVSEKDIAAALESKKKISLRKGDALLLIQSGAPIPDAEMSAALGKHFTVGVFSGVPDEKGLGSKEAGDVENRSRMLRLAAARGGYETIVCYWGNLETSKKGLATKTVSWVPVVGWAVPDETQQMRIRLKVALVDVRTGAWSTFSPPPFEESATSGHFGREGSDQSQVATLKANAYAAAAEDLLKRYSP